MVDEVASLGLKADFRQITSADKALDRLGKTSVKTSKATDALNVSSKKATSALSAEGMAAGRTAKATDALGVSTAKTTASTNALTSAVGSLKSVFGAFAGLLIVNQLKRLSDEAISVENRLRQVTSSTAELNKVFNDLLTISNRTRSELGATSTLYQRLSIASDQLGLSSKDLLRLTETINKSFAISGATASETAGAVRQLSQGLAAGALRGDEFNSVAEQAPAIMRAIADETGLTIGQLREFAATGGITAEIVVSALQNVEEEIDTKFAKSVATFSQKLTIIENDFIAWARASDELSASLNVLADSIGVGAGAVKFLLSNIDLIVAVILAKQIPAIQALIAVRAQSVIASQKALASEVAMSKATQTTTLLELEKAVAIRASTLADLAAEQVRLKAQISATGRNLSLARTIELSRANAGATALLSEATAAHSIALSRAATAQVAYNTSTRVGIALTTGLNTAMAFLGGPLGVALLASFAIFKFAESMETAEERAIRLAKEVGNLVEEFNGLTLAQLGNELVRVSSRFNKVSDELNDARKVFKQYGKTTQAVSTDVAKQVKLINDLEEELIKLGVEYETIAELQNKLFTDKLNERIEETNKLTADQTKAITSAIEKYRDLLSVIGKTAREQAVYNDIVSKGIDINSSEGQSIRLLIDAYFDQVDAIDATTKAAKEFEAATKKAARESEKASKKAAKEIEKVYKRAFNQTSDIIFDSIRDWEGGIEGFADRVGDIMKDLLARMAADFAASKVLQFFGFGGGGGFTFGGGGKGGGILGGGGGGTDIGSLLSSASTASSVFDFLFGASAAGTGGTILGGGVGGGLIVDLGPTASNFAVAADGLSGSLEGAAPWAAALTGALLGFEQSGAKGAVSGAAGGFAGAKAGAEIGTSIFPGIGTAVGAIIGGILGSVFGASAFGGQFETKDFGLQLSVAAGDLVAQSFDFQEKEGGLFNRDKRETILTELETDVFAQMQTALEAIQTKILESYSILGVELGENIFDSFSTLTVKKLSLEGKSEEQIAELVNLFFSDIADQMVGSAEATRFTIIDALQNLDIDPIDFDPSSFNFNVDEFLAAIDFDPSSFNFSELNADLEEFGVQLSDFTALTFERLNELASVLTGTNDILAAIGVGGFEGSLMGAGAAEKFIEFFGSTEDFINALSLFDTTFINTADEAFERLTGQLTAVFDSFDLELPSTREAFVELVQGLDVTTQASGEAFAVLTNLSTVIDQFYTEQERLATESFAAQERVAAEASRISADRLQLVIQEMILLGNASDALALQRVIELMAMDSSLVPLQERINALEDEAAAAAIAAQLASERTQLEIQEMILLGDASGALAIEREIELAAIDESLRPLLQRIFALQDEAVATKAAEQAAIDYANTLTTTTDTAFAALKTSLQAAVSTINENLTSRLAQADAAFNSTSASISRSIDGMRDSASDLRSVVGSIDKAISSLTGQAGGLTQVQAQTQIQTALTQARGGSFQFAESLGDALRVVSRISEEGFSTAADFRRATATTANQLKELRSLTDAELTLEERTVAALEARLVSTRQQHDATIEQLRANAAGQIEELSVIESDFLELIEIQRGTFNATISVAEAINNLTAALGIEQTGGNAGLTLVGESPSQVGVGGPNEILNTVDSTEAEGENITVVQALQNLTAEVKRGNFAIARNTSKIFKLEDRWDKNGTPPERAAL